MQKCRLLPLRLSACYGSGAVASTSKIPLPKIEKILVFRNVRVIDPSRALDEYSDVVVEAGRITNIGKDAGASFLQVSGARIIDGKGKWLVFAVGSGVWN